jgi:hypothetical protein
MPSYLTKLNDKNIIVRYSPRLHNNNKINYCYKRKYTKKKFNKKKFEKSLIDKWNYEHFSINKNIPPDYRAIKFSTFLTKKGSQDELLEIPHKLHNHNTIDLTINDSDDDWIIDDDENPFKLECEKLGRELVTQNKPWIL